MLRDFQVIRGIGSEVRIDPEKGRVEKTYKPGFPIRAMYWLAFQAKFPYESNRNALRAAELRREIAQAVLAYELSPLLVAQPENVDTDEAVLVTQFVDGTSPRDRKTARRFLKLVTKAFLRAGLPTWQVSPVAAQEPPAT